MRTGTVATKYVSFFCFFSRTYYTYNFVTYMYISTHRLLYVVCDNIDVPYPELASYPGSSLNGQGTRLLLGQMMVHAANS